jgi:hypothetical protein
MATTEEVPTAQAEEKPTPLTSSTVPAGYTIDFYTAPKRAYHIDGVEVPSVTTVLGVLDKSGLPWWAQGVAVEGILELVSRGLLVLGSD